MRIKLIRLEGLTRLVALKNMGCRAEKVPDEHDSFSQCAKYCTQYAYITVASAC